MSRLLVDGRPCGALRLLMATKRTFSTSLIDADTHTSRPNLTQFMRAHEGWRESTMVELLAAKAAIADARAEADMAEGRIDQLVSLQQAGQPVDQELLCEAIDKLKAAKDKLDDAIAELKKLKT